VALRCRVDLSPAPSIPFRRPALTEPPRSVDRGLRDCGIARWLPRNQRTTGDRRENSDGSRSAMTPPPAISPLMNDRKATHLKAAARRCATRSANRSGNKQIRGFRCAHSFPRPSEHPATPGTVARQDSCRRRDDHPHRHFLRASRKNRSTDMAGSTPCGLHESALPIVRGFRKGLHPILKAERAELWRKCRPRVVIHIYFRARRKGAEYPNRLR